MDFLNSIFYKSLSALYNLNVDRNGVTKNFLVNAIFKGLLIGKEGLDLARLEMALDTATEHWLDFWGDTFGVYRIYEEEDETYRKRIIDEIIAPKATVPALKQATSRFLKTYKDVDLDSTDVKIFEPWTQLLILDERGVLEGPGRLISHDYWRYAVIDISLPDSELITPDLIAYLNKRKAGGVRIKFSISPVFGIIRDPLWEEKRYRTWKHIQRDTYILPVNFSNAFKLMQEGWNPNIEDSSSEGLLDERGVLEGSQKVYWNGIKFSRSIYGTGVIRDIRYSAVLDFTSLSEDETFTIGDFEEVENEALTPEFLAFGKENTLKLNKVQQSIQINSSLSSVRNCKYISYTKANSNKDNYPFPYGNIFNYASFEELSEMTSTLDFSLGDFYESTYPPKSLESTDLANGMRKLKLKYINETNKRESLQSQIEIRTEQI